MYTTKDGEEVFIIDGHVHLWDASPANTATSMAAVHRLLLWLPRGPLPLEKLGAPRNSKNTAPNRCSGSLR